MDQVQKTSIEEYFDYKWQNDRNQAIDDQDEIDILD